MEEPRASVAAKGPDREEVHRPGENSSPEHPSLYPEPPDQSSEARLSDHHDKNSVHDDPRQRSERNRGGSRSWKDHGGTLR